jgi:large subunit ribosomal protein L29
MKAQEVHDMSDAELGAREHELVDELFHLRLRRATSQLPNPMKMRETKRDLARVKTEMCLRVLRGGAPVTTRRAEPKRAPEEKAKAAATPRRKAASAPRAKRGAAPAKKKAPAARRKKST